MFGVVYTQSRTLKKLGSQQCAGFYIYHQLPAHYITSSVSNGKVLPEISVELYSTCFIWQRVLRPARGHLAHVPQRRCGVLRSSFTRQAEPTHAGQSLAQH